MAVCVLIILDNPDKTIRLFAFVALVVFEQIRQWLVWAEKELPPRAIPPQMPPRMGGCERCGGEGKLPSQSGDSGKKAPEALKQEESICEKLRASAIIH